jgi:hypothetical protein
MSVMIEGTEQVSVQHSAPVRAFALIISYVFHPLFVPVYTTLFVLFLHPLMFAGYTDQMKVRLLATIFVNLTMLPAVTVFLCWRLKFIDSLHMNTQKERVIPLAAAMIFYFWAWYVLKSNVNVPEMFREFLLGCFITIIAAWMMNIAFKVSLHGLAAGGMVGFMLILTFNSDGSSPQYFALSLILAGIICSARLLAGAHKPGDVYVGLFIGVLSQVAALVL